MAEATRRGWGELPGHMRHGLEDTLPHASKKAEGGAGEYSPATCKTRAVLCMVGGAPPATWCTAGEYLPA